jgi:3-hydroxyisobutyrate dehydrogenase-like beta-hydroxyacid dehydrogenase
MGSAISRRLLETGHPVRVHDIRAAAGKGLVAA